MFEPIIVVHGGAGNIPDSSDQAKFDGILTAVRKAYASFKCTSSIIDACQAAVEYMEIDKAFNAGRGSVLNLKGEIEMEALIMEGKDMKAGKPILCHVSLKYKNISFVNYMSVNRKCYWCPKYCSSNCVGQKSNGKYTSCVSYGFECQWVCFENGIRNGER